MFDSLNELLIKTLKNFKILDIQKLFEYRMDYRHSYKMWKWN